MTKTHYEILKKSFEDIGIKFSETNYEENGSLPELMGLLIEEEHVKRKRIEHLFTKDGRHFMISSL